VDSTNDRSTPTTRTTPGTRTSATATRTGTTSATAITPARSAYGSDAPFSFAELVEAYFDCREHKRTTLTALRFEQRLEENLDELYQDLIGGTWKPGRSIFFVVTLPKAREVCAADFRDRVVHHLLYNRIGPRFERTFIADSAACIAGRGTTYAAERLEAKIRSITENWQRPAHYLKCDVFNFFPSIDKRIVARLLSAKVTEPFWLDLTMKVLFHDPRENAEVQSSPARMALIAPHKSLWTQPVWRGLPIGNLPSQFCANVLLNELDQHAKHVLRARHYGRYVDDFYLLDRSTEWLNFCRADIEAFLPAKLGLQLNPRKTVIQPIARGVDFVGQVVKPWRRTIRRRTFKLALHRMLTMPEGERFESANSYFGLLRQLPNSHQSRAAFAKLLLLQRFIVNGKLTKVYRPA
jgi:RNA-directed DNA polymerase